MIFKIQLNMRDDHAKAIIAEAEAKHTTPEKLIEDFIVENEYLNDDDFLDFMYDLRELRGIESEDD